MKKLMVASVAVVMALSGEVFAVKQSVTTNVLGMAGGGLNAIYEFDGGGPKNTIGVGANLWSMSLSGWKFSSTALGVDYNIYQGGKKFEGFYVGPSAWINMISYEYSSINLFTGATTAEKGSSAMITLGGNIGTRWLWDGGFTLGLGLGVGYTIGSVSAGGETAPYGGFGLSRLALDVGYAW